MTQLRAGLLLFTLHTKRILTSQEVDNSSPCPRGVRDVKPHPDRYYKCGICSQNATSEATPLQSIVTQTALGTGELTCEIHEHHHEVP